MKKRKIEVCVISDIHLGTREACAEELLIYLCSIKPRILVLNGDIIDTRPGVKHHFPKSHIKVIKKILNLLSDGTEVYYISGTHDGLMRKFSGREVSKLSFQDRLLLNLDGKTTCILHGEMLATAPRLARWISRMGSIGFHLMHINHRIGHWITNRSNPKSKDVAAQDIKSPVDRTSSLNTFDRIAGNLATRNGYDTLICGYTHQPKKAIYEDRKGQCLYLNSGDWVEHMTALEYSFKRWKLYNFRLDKLTAFYGDEELAEMDLPELLQKILSPVENGEKSKTAL